MRFSICAKSRKCRERDIIVVWRRRESKRDDADMRDAIYRVALSDRFYGYRRVTEQLRREGHVVNYKRVRRLMRLDNLLSLRYKPFVPRTTDSAHGYQIVCDLTNDAMLTAPDHVWSQTSPTSGCARSSSIWRWSWTPSRARSLVGRSPII